LRPLAISHPRADSSYPLQDIEARLTLQNTDTVSDKKVEMSRAEQRDRATEIQGNRMAIIRVEVDDKELQTFFKELSCSLTPVPCLLSLFPVYCLLYSVPCSLRFTLPLFLLYFLPYWLLQKLHSHDCKIASKRARASVRSSGFCLS
jgi:hypothetical protein